MKTSNTVVALALSIGLFTTACGGGSSTSTTARNPASPQPQPTPTSTVPPGGGEVTPLRTGIWGGQDSALTVQDTGAQFRYNCTSGSIQSQILLDRSGSFVAQGTITESSGGPTTPGQTKNATYRGTLNGDKLSLNVSYTNDAGNVVQYVDTLTYGFEGPLPTPCPL